MHRVSFVDHFNRHVCRLRVKTNNWRFKPSRQRSIPKAQTQGLFVCLRGTDIRANITQITCCDYEAVTLFPINSVKSAGEQDTHNLRNLWDRQLNTGISVPWAFLPVTDSKTPDACVCSHSFVYK